MKATLGKNQLHAFAFISRVEGWHSFAPDRATREAVAGLVRRGLAEKWNDMFRLA